MLPKSKIALIVTAVALPILACGGSNESDQLQDSDLGRTGRRGGDVSLVEACRPEP